MRGRLLNHAYLQRRLLPDTLLVYSHVPVSTEVELTRLEILSAHVQITIAYVPFNMAFSTH